MRWLVSIVLVILFVPSFSHAQVEILDARVVDQSFSRARLELTLRHDGSYGDDVWFGVTPVTRSPIYGFSYSPQNLPIGEVTMPVVLSRPTLENQIGFLSHEIRLNFYNPAETVDFDLNHKIAIEWPNFSDFYGITPGPASPDYSIKHLHLTDSLYYFESLVQWFSDNGLELNNIELEARGKKHDKPVESLPLFVSEDVSFEDLSGVLYQLADKGTRVSSIGVFPLTDQRYPLGYMSLGIVHVEEQTFLIPAKFQQMLDATSKEEIYSIAEFTPTRIEEFINSSMERVIALNDTPYKNDARRAIELANVVLDRDPANVRAYVELARAELGINGSVALPNSKNTVEFALSLEPGNPWANHYGGFIEMRLGNYEEALQRFEIAEATRGEQEITWLIVNWGDTFRRMGRPRLAIEKYELLMDKRNLDSHNMGALYRGLNRYAELLEELEDNGLIAVYEKLYREFPDKSTCVPTELGIHYISRESDTVKAREMLDLSNELECENHGPLVGLLDIHEWYERKGSKTDLFRALMTHHDRSNLVYRIASMKNGEAILRRMVEFEIDIDETDVYGATPIMKAIENSNIIALENIVAAGANVNQTSEYMGSPLFAAVSLGEVESVRILLQHGADPSMPLPFGFSVLEIKDQIENPAIRQLLERRAGLNV